MDLESSRARVIEKREKILAGLRDSFASLGASIEIPAAETFASKRPFESFAAKMRILLRKLQALESIKAHLEQMTLKFDDHFGDM